MLKAADHNNIGLVFLLFGEIVHKLLATQNRLRLQKGFQCMLHLSILSDNFFMSQLDESGATETGRTNKLLVRVTSELFVVN